jgi:hypothetical protein
LYGKIYGDFDADFLRGRIGFTYYLNPEPNSRNMEYDPKQNLFLMAADKEVKTLEEARNKLWREKQQRLDEAGEKALQDAYNAEHKLESSCLFLSP